MPEHYAFLYDRVMSNNGKGKQCYGMQWIVNSKGTYDFASFDDIENVDLRRREIGLLPLGDWIKYNHTKVPDGYIRK